MNLFGLELAILTIVTIYLAIGVGCVITISGLKDRKQHIAERIKTQPGITARQAVDSFNYIKVVAGSALYMCALLLIFIPALTQNTLHKPINLGGLGLLSLATVVSFLFIIRLPKTSPLDAVHILNQEPTR